MDSVPSRTISAARFELAQAGKTLDGADMIASGGAHASGMVEMLKFDRSLAGK